MEEKPLDEFLKDAYPDATEKEIAQYIDWIESYEAEKLPLTKEMAEYAENDTLIKEKTERNKELKETIIAQKKRLGKEFRGLSVTEVNQRNFKESAFYEWVRSIASPYHLAQMTIKTIDMKKFHELEALGKIGYDEIPEEVFDLVPQWRLQVSRPRKRNK